MIVEEDNLISLPELTVVIEFANDGYSIVHRIIGKEREISQGKFNKIVEALGKVLKVDKEYEEAVDNLYKEKEGI